MALDFSAEAKSGLRLPDGVERPFFPEGDEQPDRVRSDIDYGDVQRHRFCLPHRSERQNH
jgi:hypothetical protein